MDTKVMKTHAPWLAAATLPGLLLSGKVAAADAADAALELDTLTVVAEQPSSYRAGSGVTGSKTDTPLQEVPQSIQVVTRAEIEDSGAGKLKDVITRVAGVNQTLGEGARDEFVIRGFNAGRDIYKNGVRDDRGFQTFRSLSNIERVEVLKGPAGALYGRGSAGGLINLVTKKPVSETVAELTLRAGSDEAGNARYSAQADVGGAVSSSVAGRLTVEQSQGDSFVDHVDEETLFVAPSLAWQLGRDTELLLELEYLEQELVPYRGIPAKDGQPVAVSRSSFFGSSEDFQDTTSYHGALTLTHAFSDNVSLRNVLTYGETELTQIAARNAGLDADGETLKRTLNGFGFDPERVWGDQLELLFEVGRHRILLGGEYHNFYRDFTLKTDKNFASININDPHDAPHSEAEPEPFRENTVETVAAYLQDQIDLGDSVHLLLGVRHDQITRKQQKAGQAEEDEFDFSRYSPRAGLVLDLNEQHALYATVGRSYQLDYGGIYVDNRFAKPLKTDLQEVGYKAESLDGDLSLNLAVFEITQEDPRQNKEMVVEGIDENRHRGVELDIRGQLSDRWSLIASYSYIEAENRATGKRPNDVPEQTAALWTTYRLTDHFTIGAGADYVGERFVGNDEAVKLDDYVVADLMASYAWEHQKLTLNVRNVLDEKYHAGATNGAAGANQIGFGEPLNAMLTYQISL